MKIEKTSMKKAAGRDLEVFRKRLLAELKTHQDRVDRARGELPVDSEPDDDAGIASRSSYREVTMGKLERDLQNLEGRDLQLNPGTKTYIINNYDNGTASTVGAVNTSGTAAETKGGTGILKRQQERRAW